VQEVERKPGTDLLSFHYDLAAGTPWINKPGFVAALRLLQRLQACRPPSTPAPEAPAAFRDGRAVLCLASPVWVSRFQETGAAVRNRFSMCRVPGAGR